MSAQASLDAALLAAHATGDRSDLIRLYADASRASQGTAAAFYLTHAYIFALEAGDPQAAHLRDGLVDMGAEAGL